jgi:serine protease Do
VGDFVLAAGNPFGLDHSVSLGIVSAKERVIGAGPYDDFIQTDAAINPGNSGGPLFNMKGEVVGVNTAIVAQGQGIGFAVPINMVKDLLPQLLETGKVTRGWLGVTIQQVTPELAKSFGLGKAGGALIAGVMKNGPAGGSGLKRGDVVTAVNGRKVETYNQLSRFVATLPPGSKASLSVMREGKEKTIEVKVGTRPEDEELLAQGGEGDDGQQETASDKLGISVAPMSPQAAQRLGVEGGVQISSIKPESAAARAGARPGDVIVELQRQPVRSVQDYAQVVRGLRPGDTALILVQRANAAVYIAVPIR